MARDFKDVPARDALTGCDQRCPVAEPGREERRLHVAELEAVLPLPCRDDCRYLVLGVGGVEVCGLYPLLACFGDGGLDV